MYNTYFVYMEVDFTMYMYIAHVQYMCLPFTNWAMGIGYTVIQYHCVVDVYKY